jgi:hypothetical protein
MRIRAADRGRSAEDESDIMPFFKIIINYLQANAAGPQPAATADAAARPRRPRPGRRSREPGSAMVTGLTRRASRPARRMASRPARPSTRCACSAARARARATT